MLGGLSWLSLVCQHKQTPGILVDWKPLSRLLSELVRNWRYADMMGLKNGDIEKYQNYNMWCLSAYNAPGSWGPYGNIFRAPFPFVCLGHWSAYNSRKHLSVSPHASNRYLLQNRAALRNEALSRRQWRRRHRGGGGPRDLVPSSQQGGEDNPLKP